MKGVSLSIRLAACLALLLSGCKGTRMPSLAYGDPKADVSSYNYHDPLPEGNVGPLVERPRSAMIQRSEPRRTMEHAIKPMNGDFPQSSARYPDSVTP